MLLSCCLCAVFLRCSMPSLTHRTPSTALLSVSRVRVLISSSGHDFETTPRVSQQSVRLRATVEGRIWRGHYGGLVWRRRDEGGHEKILFFGFFWFLNGSSVLTREGLLAGPGADAFDVSPAAAHCSCALPHAPTPRHACCVYCALRTLLAPRSCAPHLCSSK